MRSRTLQQDTAYLNSPVYVVEFYNRKWALEQVSNGETGVYWFIYLVTFVCLPRCLHRKFIDIQEIKEWSTETVGPHNIFLPFPICSMGPLYAWASCMVLLYPLDPSELESRSANQPPSPLPPKSVTVYESGKPRWLCKIASYLQVLPGRWCCKKRLVYSSLTEN